jgi:hypothetical protein
MLSVRCRLFQGRKNGRHGYKICAKGQEDQENPAFIETPVENLKFEDKSFIDSILAKEMPML